MMNIIFEPLNESHFSLLLKWLESTHVKKWWDCDVVYTLDLVKEKYQSYVKGYKEIDGINKPIKAYIIFLDQTPIGYSQLYNAYNFPRSKVLMGLPKNLGAFDIFIGEEKYLGQSLGSRVIEQFLNLYAQDYPYIFVDPDLDNIAAIKAYKKADFHQLSQEQETHEIWMLRENKISSLSHL